MTTLTQRKVGFCSQHHGGNHQGLVLYFRYAPIGGGLEKVQVQDRLEGPDLPPSWELLLLLLEAAEETEVWASWLRTQTSGKLLTTSHEWRATRHSWYKTVVQVISEKNLMNMHALHAPLTSYLPSGCMDAFTLRGSNSTTVSIATGELHLSGSFGLKEIQFTIYQWRFI